MSEVDALRSLINLIGDRENYSCNVIAQSALDSEALKELNSIQAKTHNEKEHFDKMLTQFHCPKIDLTSKPTNWTYATHLYYILHQIRDELEKHDEFPASINDAKKIHVGIHKAIEYGLKPYLLATDMSDENSLQYIIASVNFLIEIECSKYFSVICTRSDQNLVYKDLLSGVYVILCAGDEQTKSKYETLLTEVQSHISLSDLFKILFLIQGNNGQSMMRIQQIVHKQLLHTLYREGSFVALCEALLPSITCLDQDEEIVKKRLHCYAVISSILARRGYSKKFYLQIIDEIHQHLLKFIRSENRSHQLYYIDVGTLCLTRLYTLQLNFITRHIIDNIFGVFEKIISPDDLLTGAIVCEHSDFIDAVHLVHLTFCASGPSDVTLPSEILTPYLPLFFQLHNLLDNFASTQIKKEIIAITVRCLSNRETDELNKIIERILYEDFSDGVKRIHPRVKLNRIFSNENELFSFTITAVEMANNNTEESTFDITAFLQSSATLVNLLKQSNHNVLIYNAFLHLLQMFSDNFATLGSLKIGSENSSELLGNEDELTAAIETNFKRKYAVINALNELILFKPFHAQFAENPHDIIEILNDMLNRQIEQIQMPKRQSTEENEEVLIVILSIVGDFLQQIRYDDLKLRLHQTLRKLKSILQNRQMETVMKKLNSVLEPQTKLTNLDFSVAKAILSETHSEPYIKVYGIMTTLKLINANDEETILNAHSILALAIKLLREEDSYIFLNCIKLLISLVPILEDTVLETLVAEYHLDFDGTATDTDFKLKIGETIVKVTQGLGEMCHKYKDMLVNCFLRGACHSNDEFRTSNISNLGVIMRILSYQVHHFFQEMMTIIRQTVESDKYLPARRASALVLVDLLNGIPSLMEYEQYLLPLYRSLKHIAENDADLKMQIHARNGLECLKDKIKETLNSEPKFEKEIKIFGVKGSNDTVRFH